MRDRRAHGPPGEDPGIVRDCHGPGRCQPRDRRPGAHQPHVLVAAVRGDGQRGRIARRRAGRPAQQLGAASGDRGVPGGAGDRAGNRRLGPRLHHRLRRRIRVRHPRRRVPRPFALPHIPHHRHRRDAGGRRSGRTPAETRRRPHAACAGFGRHAGGRSLGVPARCGRLQAAAHGQGGVQWPDGGLAGPRRLHRRAPHPRGPDRDGGRHVDRRRPRLARRQAGRARKPRSSSMRHAGIPIRQPMRCSN